MKKFLKWKDKLEEKVLFKIFRAILYVVVVVMLILIGVQRFSDNNIAVGGFRVFMVVSESMKKSYDIGDILVSKKVPTSDIKVGDDVTYKGEKGNLRGLIITHRVIKKEEKDGHTVFVTKGTSNSIADPEINESQIYGKVVYKTIFLSFLGRIMMNKVAGYILFIIIGFLLSIEIVSAIFSSDDEEEEKDAAKE